MLEHAIEQAMYEEISWLMRLNAAPPLDFAGLSKEAMTPHENASFQMVPLFRHQSQAIACLRIEATSDVLRELEQSMHWYMWHRGAERIGPARFKGVAMYEIQWPATLPPPGWRVVNPFRKEG